MAILEFDGYRRFESIPIKPRLAPSPITPKIMSILNDIYSDSAFAMVSMAKLNLQISERRPERNMKETRIALSGHL